MPRSSYGPCTHRHRIFFDEENKPAKYSLQVRRRHPDGWYDEIRYDSHQTRQNKEFLSPHFHMKIRSGFKHDAGKALEQIQLFIDNYLEAIEEVMK